jgi:cytoskeleton protein RodZ
VRQPGVAPRGEQSASRPVAASEPADEPARPPADDAARNDARTVASAPVPARVPAPEDTTADVLADVEDDGLDAVHAAAARPPQSLVRRISPEGEDRVDFEFSEDCWVEVADAGGRNFSDLARAGDTLVLVGQAPFRIRLGYGPGASVAFNGQVVALAPHTRRSNVTFLVLDPAAGEVDE